MGPQQIIAHYRITAKLGEGGMGEVWRATDTKLNRDVAIKFLPEAFAQDPDRLARFTREAQVLASLNHPSIAAIYGVEECALVMELVEGVTLAERIARGPVPEEEARPIIDQLIDALEYAHAKGVVHRDLKPANIKLTPEGRVKVLDFGLAKAVAGETAVHDPASSPTLTMRATMAGVIVGTAAYMAPEQARGQNVDERADIWAFGVIAYEMLTGRQLFGGPTVSDILAAVLKETPDLETVPASTRTLVRYCLEKDPRRRMRDIGDGRILLDRAQGSLAVPAAQASWRAILPWCFLGAVVIVSLLGAGFWLATRPIDRPLMWLSVDLGPDAKASRDLTAAISPDGTRLVFSAGNARDTRLAVRSLGQPNAIPLAGTEGGFDPFFSPDGEWVAFGAGGKLKKISVHGGSPVTLCDGGLRGGSWGEDGYIIASLGNSVGLSRIPEAGGSPQPLTKPEYGEMTHRWPQVLPGGKAVLFSANITESDWEQANIQVLSLKTGQRKTIQHGGFFGRYLPSGHLIYIHGGSLYGMPFDIERLEPKGPPATLLEDVAASTFGGGQLDFSRNGTLVYLSGKASSLTRPLVWIDAAGKKQPFFAAPGYFSGPTLSPDGKRLAVTMLGGDLWVYDLEREIPIKLALAGRAFGVVWAPDGRHLVYGTPPGKKSGGLMWIRADGSGEPQQLTQGDIQFPSLPYCVSPDGRHVIFGGPGSPGMLGTKSVTIDTREPDHPKAGEPEPLLISARMGGVAISPDGRWLAYSAGDSGQPQVFVRPFVDGKVAGNGMWQISAAGGAYPVWSKVSRQVLYESPDTGVMVVDYTADADSFHASKPRLWVDKRIGSTAITGNVPFNMGFRPFDLTPDGKRIITWEADEQEGAKVNLHVTMLVNWFDELRRRLPRSGK
jgi:serine/threonine-protein kinase